MSKISDELKRIADSDIVCGHTWVELSDIADRIDFEMVELPNDADGEPIHVGDTVFVKSGNGEEETVSSITLTGGTAAVTTACRGIKAGFRPAELTHKRPDSWERIAYDIETVVSIDDDGDMRFRRELADRVRRLSKEGGHES